MRFLSEEESAALITEEIAFDAVREALIAATTGQTFPAVFGHGTDPGNRFTVKSGASAELAGVKVGSFWPGNDAKGMPRHNSTILLLDQETGRTAAVIEAGKVNAFRTAAADAVAADVLARRDATTLAIFGTGHQALYECVAVSKVRDLESVQVVARSADRGERFVELLSSKGLRAQLSTAQDACQADIIVTATTSRAPLFDADWVRPGTHVASMGSDARGKQELPPELLAKARLFCDLPEQSVQIGEMQHAIDATGLTALGDVLTGKAEGRVADDDITVFDSSGIALQDLYVAVELLRR
ncbi:ornithine cyclodeaminase family protein [Kibdelosporangium philippinense]|uniref:Ornithine cyclodeaminase family protein n=1 Tax=Kibdelosporangium philippinense TaxID=211113 RepID=A0ABS8ZIA1_9PSEU|nr:ornithine cyclodeaminase family protein [Kibdelosporangium philippinense]MCE7007531.1 ornithine cyclodeaminase family protein [Kibdelosporangium philippinense]